MPRRIPIQTPHGRFLPLVQRPGVQREEKGVILPPSVPPPDDAIGPIDSTDNVGLPWGVQSVDPASGPETEGYVLTADGDGGSVWAPAGTEESSPFFEAVADLAATRDLRGYWRLGEGAAPFADTSGHANGAANASVAGSGTAMDQDITGALSATQDDGAVEFLETDGTDGEYLSTSDPGIDRFNFNSGDDDFTVTAFLKANASGSTFTGHAVGTWGNSGGVCGWRIGVTWPTRSPFIIRRSSGGTQSFITGPTLTAATWYFVAATYSSTGGQKLYIDGALVGVNPTTHSASATFGTGPTFGRWLGAPTDSFYGGLDEVTIWGDVLTAAEIATLADSGGFVSSEFLSVVSTTGAYTLTSNDDVLLASGSFTVTLPTAVGIGGKEFKIKNTGSGSISVAQSGSETIDGSTTDVFLAANDAVDIVSDGAGWYIVAAYSYP